MGKIRNNNDGFSVVEVVLVLVIVGLVGVVGWMVYKNHHKVATNSTATTSSTKPITTQKTTSTPADPYAGWKTFTSSSLGVSFKYPATWTVTQGEPQCTGAVLVTVTPSATDVSNAATVVNNSQLKKYVLLVDQFGTKSAKCAADGNDFKDAKYAYLRSADAITAGAFKGDYLTFFGSTTGDTSAKLPDTGIVTTIHYTTQGAFTNSGTVTASGKTFQIDINTDTGQYTQNPVPVRFDPSLLKNSGLYKNTLLVLNSMQ